MRALRITALVALLALVVAAAGCGARLGRPAVALPPADASPAAVARAYVQALDRGDRDALRELATADHADQAIHWLSNLKGVRLVHAGRVIRDVGPSASTRRHRKAVYVPAVLDLDLHDPGRSGFSTDGRTTWGYMLVKDAPTDRWRVDDEGAF